MSTQLFALLFILGSAAIALWAVVRFPRWAPSDFKSALVHLGISLVAMYVLVPILNAALDVVAQPFQTHISMFAVLLPAFVYRLVSMIWLLRLAQSGLGSALR